MANPLFFPKPAGSYNPSKNLTLNSISSPTLQSTSSSTSSSTSTSNSIPNKVPPLNFSEARIRSKARELRRNNKNKVLAKINVGKQKDLSDLTIEQLNEMFNRNQSLLDSPSLLAALPTGDTKLLISQNRIQLRIKELNELNQLRLNLYDTHLNEEEEEKDLDKKLNFNCDFLDNLNASTSNLNNLNSSNSPRTKERLMSMNMTSTDKSKTTIMSLKESIELQRLAAIREKLELEKIQKKLELNLILKHQTTGNLLKSTMKNQPEMSGFMFHEDSEGEEGGEFGLSGELDEEEEGSLNPYRAAYVEGYERAEAEG